MGAWAGQPNIGGMQPQQQGGDVPPFDLPQAPQMPMPGGQGPMPNLQGGGALGGMLSGILGGPGAQGPMPGGDMQYRDPGIGNSPRQQMRMPSGDEAPDHKAYLRQLYRQELGRNVDPEGYNYWLQQMNNGMSQDQVRQMFDQSQEGQAYNQRPPELFPEQPKVYPPPFSNDPRNPHMPPEIADALRLANQPQQDQVSSTMLGWIMDGGGEMPRMGTADLRPINRNELSPEQRQRFNEYMRPGYERNIRNLYQQELGRKEGDQAGMDYWRQQFENGMTMDQARQMFNQSEEGRAYDQRPMPPRPLPVYMPPEVEDALRLANQTRPGGGVGGPHMSPRPVFGSGPNDGGSMPRGVKDLLQGLLPPQPNYNRAPPSQEELDYAQRLGKEPFSPEVQDALRTARGLPVY